MKDPTIVPQRHIPPESRLWRVLDGDPYSYHLVPAAPAHFRMKLNTSPADVAVYVQDRIPSLVPFDWWWVRGNDGKVEVCIRMDKVFEIAG